MTTNHSTPGVCGEENAIQQQHTDASDAVKAIVLFVVITFALSAVFIGAMVKLGAMEQLYVTAVMWMPAVGAFLTCALLKRPIASLPWAWGEWRWNIYAWSLPLLAGLVAYSIVWGFGLGGFPNMETVDAWANQFGLRGAPAAVVITVGVVMLATAGIIGSLARALGEEIGWRGFLIWELRKLMPFWAVGIVSGVIWGLWHVPAILGTDYNAGTGNPVFQVALFLANVITASIIFAYFTFRARSLWPAAILHASHNLFVQAIYTPLTVFGSETHKWVDEFGIMLPVIYGILAIYFIRRARIDGL
ncbi:MAG: CPBP family intramembrane glutamic endopeptidase [Woeseiaceae bacterium]